MSNFRIRRKNLRTLVNSLNGAFGGSRVIAGDEPENIFQPSLGFFSPSYCCHERMRCAISSFEIVRFASESASPRSTIT